MSHACMSDFTDIRRASLYEQAARQCGLRMQAAIAGAPEARSNRLLLFGNADVRRHVHFIRLS